MPEITLLRNLGALVRTAFAAAFTSLTAGGAGNNTAIVGAVIDRLDPINGSLANSVVFAIPYTTSLSAGKNLAINAVSVSTNTVNSVTGASTYQSSANNPGLANQVVATASGSGIVQFAVDVRGANRFVFLNFTPDLSNTTTDTATVGAVAVMGGYDAYPA